MVRGGLPVSEAGRAGLLFVACDVQAGTLCATLSDMERIYSFGGYKPVATIVDELPEQPPTELCGSDRWHMGHVWYRRQLTGRLDRIGAPASAYTNEMYYCPGIRDFRDIAAVDAFLEDR